MKFSYYGLSESIKDFLKIRNLIYSAKAWKNVRFLLQILNAIWKLYINLVGLYTVSKVSDNIGIIKSIPVSVSERQINNTFHNDINKHKAILIQKWFKKKKKFMFCVCLIISF